MTQPKYKLLVIDYGGVYSHGYDRETPYKIARELFGCERPPTRNSVELTSLEDRFMSGVISTQEYIDELAAILNAQKKPSPEQLQDRMLEAAKDPTPIMIELVKNVRVNGIQVALLSDMGAFEIPIAEKLGRFDNLDYVFLSAREGVSKKNKRYFEILSERTGYKPEEVIFFDDSEYCIETARKFGMESILVAEEEVSHPEGLPNMIYTKLGISSKNDGM